MQNPVNSTQQQSALRHITRLPAHQRAQALLQQTDCSLLVRCMPTQDLLITYKATDDPHHRTALMQHIPPGQMQRLWDLDLWVHHRIQPQRLVDWLQALCNAGIHNTIIQLRGLDHELLCLLFKTHIDIYDQYQWDNLDEDKTLFTHTPDRAFILVSRDNNEITFGCLRQFVEFLYGENPSAAVNLLMNVIAETPSALEEKALHWRDARLQDLGFLPTAQWQDVLAYSDPQTLAQQVCLTTKQPNRVHQPHLVAARLQLRLDKTDPQDLLKRAIAQLDEQSSQHVARQLLVLTNRIHAAWHKDLSNEESLTNTTHETVACLQMALQYLQQAYNKPPSHWLLDTPIQDIFRLGRSLPLHLAKQLQKSLLSQKIDNINSVLPNLNTPYRETLQGLLYPQPRFFEGLATTGQEGHSPFATLQQLALTAQIATEAAFRLSLLWGKGGIAICSGLQLTQARQIPTCDVLLATWLTRGLLEDTPCCKPLAPDHLHAIKQRLLLQQDSVWQFTAAAQQQAQQCTTRLLPDRIPLPGATSLDQAAKRAKQHVNTVLNAVAQEIGPITGSHVDPRFVQTVWTAPAKP